jgi:hypothetical protein
VLFISWNILSMYIFSNMVCPVKSASLTLASHRRLRKLFLCLPTGRQTSSLLSRRNPQVQESVGKVRPIRHGIYPQGPTSPISLGSVLFRFTANRSNYVGYLKFESTTRLTPSRRSCSNVNGISIRQGNTTMLRLKLPISTFTSFTMQSSACP